MTFTPFDHDHPDSTGWIRTYTGRWVSVIEPTADMIDIIDIAHSLPLVARFGGHTASMYSVGEHSLNVCAMLWRQYGMADVALYGLLHDAPEAYLGDVVRPLKRALAEYVTLETRMTNAVGLALGLPLNYAGHPLVKEADEAMLVYEMATVRDAPWRVPPPADVIEQAFLERYEELRWLAGGG
jgi:hypothetical protein